MEKIKHPSVYTSIPSYTLHRYGPGDCTSEAEEKLIDFLFPFDIFINEREQMREISLYFKYHNQATVYIASLNDRTIATFRVIHKRTENEFLPIESAMVVNSAASPFSDYLVADKSFFIHQKPDALPAMELGGLRIANDLPQTLKYRLLSRCFLEGENEIIRAAGKFGFMTCVEDPSLQRLYERNCMFKYFATIKYSGGPCFTALYRQEWLLLIKANIQSKPMNHITDAFVVTEEEFLPQPSV